MRGKKEMAKKDHAYAVGRIRVLETKLLPLGFFTRLLNTATEEEARRLLGETAYGSKDPGENGEDAFTGQLQQVYDFLRELTADAPELLVFLRRWDLHNLKILVAAPGRGPASRLGLIPYDRLEKLV